MNAKKFYDKSNTYVANLQAGTLSANRSITLPDASDELAGIAATQTLTNKTLTLPVIDGVTYIANDRQNVCRVVAVSGATVHAAVTSLLVLPAAALILRVVLDITTKSTGASTTSVGYTATTATTASDTFLKGIDSSTAAAVFDSMDPKLDTGTEAHAQKGASGKWITISETSGDVTGLVANAYIFFVLI